MPKKNFRLMIIMSILAGVFWLIGLIPFVHIFTDFTYWLIYIFVWLHNMPKQLMNPKVILISGGAAILSLIPFCGFFNILGTIFAFKAAEENK